MQDFGPLTNLEINGLAILTNDFIPFKNLKPNFDFIVFDGLNQRGLADMKITYLYRDNHPCGNIYDFRLGTGQVLTDNKQIGELENVGNS